MILSKYFNIINNNSQKFKRIMSNISYNPEKYIKGQSQPIPISTLKSLIQLSEKCICKIEAKGLSGTGSFISINMDSQHSVKALLTNNHVLKEEFILPGKTINISMNNEANYFQIKLDKNRKIFTSKIYDVTIIQIKKKDNLNINYFFEIDNNIYKDLSFYKDKSIILLHYPKGTDMNFSPGIIKSVAEDNYNILHTCSTDPGSSGGPILNKRDYKIIGIHKGADKNKDINYGSLLKKPLEEYKKLFSEKDIKNLDKIDNKINGLVNGNMYIDDIKDLNNKNSKNDEILIQYKINDLENYYSGDTEIFGREFVENNKSFCKIIYNNNEYDLSSHLRVNKKLLNNNNIFEIILKGVNNIDNMKGMFRSYNSIPLYSLPDISKLNTEKITNMSYMFDGCELLTSLPNISNWDTQKVTDMRYMFNRCKSLASLPDISNWDTQNVTNMSHMFDGCELLTSLPDISNWDTQNVTDMSYMFSQCKSLRALPDISRWNVENVIKMGYMFHDCSELASLPDISKWNISNSFLNVNMKGLFSGCKSLSNLPDISKWDTSFVGNISEMFCGCTSLASIPNISNWNTIHVSNISSLFCGCTSLWDLPDISKWNTSSVMDMNKLFYDCKLLSSLPDISKWETRHVTDISEMFYNCKSLKELPNISNWKFKNLENKNDMFVGCNKKIIPKKFKSDCFIF